MIYWVADLFGSIFGGFYYKNFILKIQYVDTEVADGNIKSMQTPENYTQAMNLKY